MKVSRLHSGIYLIVFSLLSLLTGKYSFQLFYDLTSYESVVKIDSAINNASLFTLFTTLIIVSLLSLLMFLTGKSLNWIPKLILIFFSILVCIAFVYGWNLTTSAKNNLHEKGYIECTSKRKIALKYSSQTYVLPPATCD